MASFDVLILVFDIAQAIKVIIKSRGDRSST